MISLCPRCGSERIILKTWTEKIDVSTVRCIQRVCPDKKCQKILDDELQKQQDKRDMMTLKKEERMLAKKAERDAIRTLKNAE